MNLTAWLRAAIGRLAGIVTGALLIWLSSFGIQVTQEDAQVLEAGLTVVGWIVGMVGYAFGHKFVNRWFNPADSAQKTKRDIV